MKKKLKFGKVSSASILKILKEFKANKATGVGNLDNLSIKLASFPDKCKVAKIKPFYKKCFKTDLKNFRPISLLPLISNIIERIMTFMIKL